MENDVSKIPSVDIPRWIFAFLAVILSVVLFIFFIWPRPCYQLGSKNYGQCQAESSSDSHLPILARGEKKTFSAMQYESSFTLTEPGLLFFRASAEAAYKGDIIGTAGHILRLSINGKTCSADRNLTRNATSVLFATSASCMEFLGIGEYTLVAATTQNGNKDRSMSANYVVFKE